MTRSAATSLMLMAIFLLTFSVFRPGMETAAVSAQEPPSRSSSVSRPAAVDGALNDPHLLYVLSQMEMALGDVDSAVQLAERAARLENSSKKPAPQPTTSPAPCSLLEQTATRQSPAPEPGHHFSL